MGSLCISELRRKYEKKRKEGLHSPWAKIMDRHNPIKQSGKRNNATVFLLQNKWALMSVPISWWDVTWAKGLAFPQESSEKSVYPIYCKTHSLHLILFIILYPQWDSVLWEIAEYFFWKAWRQGLRGQKMLFIGIMVPDLTKSVKRSSALWSWENSCCTVWNYIEVPCNTTVYKRV